MFENIGINRNKKYFLFFYILPLIMGIKLCFISDAYGKGNQVPSKKLKDEVLMGEVEIKRVRSVPNLSYVDIENLRKAAGQGTARAWFELGAYGLCEKPAHFCYEKAAELGDINATLVLISRTLFLGSSKEMDHPKIKNYFDLLEKKQDDSYVFWTNICEYSTPPKYPEEDKPTKDEIKKLNRFCYYYEDQVFKNDAEKQELKIKHRKCLLSPEMEAGYSTSLAEIYANGWGVKVNWKLAISIICDPGTVYMEGYQMDGLLHNLTMGLKNGKLDREFLLCGVLFNHYVCTEKIVRAADAQRERREKALVAKFSKNEKRAYNKLKKMTKSFTMNQWELEPKDLFLNGYSLMVETQSSLNNYLINQLEEFEEKNFSTDHDFKDADTELNKVYKEIMKIKNDDHFINGITKQGIKKTQRSWIAYRDALDEFCIIRYPQIHKNQCKTIVTRQRISDLNDLLNPPEQEDQSG